MLVAAFLGLAIALPFLVPLKPLFPGLESQLSIALGEPVRFEGLRAGLLPHPYLEARAVSVGDDRALRATRARLYPELLSLFEATTFIKLTELDEVTLDRNAIQRFFGEGNSREGGLQRIRLGHVRASHVRLEVLAGKLGEFDAEADLNRDNRLINFALTSSEGKMKFEAVPASRALLLTFSAQDWKPPAGPAIAFDRVYAQGALSEGKLAISEFTAGLYHGNVRGGLELTWGDAWVISGRVQMSRVDLAPLLQALQSPLPVRGSLDSELHFALGAAKPEQLAESLKLDGRFKVGDGVLTGFDFPSVIQGASSQGVRGGQTRFEQFSGNLQSGSGYRFTNLHLASGKNARGSELNVGGNIAVDGNGRITGAMNVELKGASTALGSTVQTAGTLDDPVLLPPAH